MRVKCPLQLNTFEHAFVCKLVSRAGLEPATLCLKGTCSTT
jgi:hypothetical protein